MEKITYYKVVCDEYPGGVLHESKVDALRLSKDLRDYGDKAYVRAVKLTKEDFEKSEEI